MPTGTRELGFGMGHFPSTSVQEAPEMLGAVRHGAGGDLLGTGQGEDFSVWCHTRCVPLGPPSPAGTVGFAQITLNHWDLTQAQSALTLSVE